MFFWGHSERSLKVTVNDTRCYRIWLISNSALHVLFARYLMRNRHCPHCTCLSCPISTGSSQYYVSQTRRRMVLADDNEVQFLFSQNWHNERLKSLHCIDDKTQQTFKRKYWMGLTLRVLNDGVQFSNVIWYCFINHEMSLWLVIKRQEQTGRNNTPYIRLFMPLTSLHKRHSSYTYACMWLL